MIIAKLVVMFSHYSDVLDRLLTILSLVWVFTILERKLCDGIDNGTSGWSADLPVSQTQAVFNIGVNCSSLETRRVILESGFVLGLHLEFLEQGISEAEVRML